MRFASGEWARLGLLIYVLFVDLCTLFVVCAMIMMMQIYQTC
jgi:hypothetical protein